LGPLLIFRFPLLGGLLTLPLDASDVMLFEAFGSGPLTDHAYHNFDKFFDTYYLTIEFLVARKWANSLARNTAISLFIVRFTGFFLFEAGTFLRFNEENQLRPLFLLAPNIFENFFLAWLFIEKVKPTLLLTKKKLSVILLVVGIPKLIQEYVMHYAYIDQTWNFLRDHLFWWLYS
jgi:hypothetical protein